VTHAPTPLTIRTAHEADWPAIKLIAATGFGSWRAPETNEVWRTMMPADSAVVACDGTQCTKPRSPKTENDASGTAAHDGSDTNRSAICPCITP